MDFWFYLTLKNGILDSFFFDLHLERKDIGRENGLLKLFFTTSNNCGLSYFTSIAQDIHTGVKSFSCNGIECAIHNETIILTGPDDSNPSEKLSLTLPLPEFKGILQKWIRFIEINTAAFN